MMIKKMLKMFVVKSFVSTFQLNLFKNQKVCSHKSETNDKEFISSKLTFGIEQSKLMITNSYFYCDPFYFL